jgi:arylsulfatase
MAAQWDAWAQRSYVDPWLHSYDPYLKGKPRQNWGGGETPERPWAMKREVASNEENKR